MSEIFYYISSILILLSVFLISFTRSSSKVFYNLVMLLLGIAGYFFLLNFNLPAVLLTLILITASAVLFLLGKFLNKVPSESAAESKFPLLSIVMLSLLTALTASVAGTAKWQQFNTDYLSNNFSAVINTYLPVLIAAALLFSAFISVILKLFLPGRADH